MNYCVNARQPKSILMKADEIKVAQKDYDIIYDFIDNYPDKTIILVIEDKVFFQNNLTILKTFNEKIANFYLELYTIELLFNAKSNNFKSFWHFPITSFYDLQGVLYFQPDFIVLREPLSFDLEKVKTITDIPIRLCANLAYEPYLQRTNGICGQWIRPEDVTTYESYVHTLEFYETDLSKEATLLHIYQDEQSWPGNLNLLIKKLDFNIDNRALPDDFAEKRIRCGQRCQKNGNCAYCQRAFELADLIRQIHQSKKTLKEHN